MIKNCTVGGWSPSDVAGLSSADLKQYASCWIQSLDNIFDWFPFPWRAIRYLMHLKERVANEIRWIIVNEGKLEDKYGHRWRF